ncbi:MAG TPA: MBL fold metallo-hydrolase [Acidimicrobiales bacterium]|jgi:L-ascorbate metabolism protein UlaG (beta-lactamase superfamily)|nr:MBL fold metallo-hydrolase [Acidimicrobiales bacterium]
MAASPIVLAGTGEPEPAGGLLTFIGTATVLVRAGGFTFLTDPNFLHQGDSAKLGYGLRSKRLTEPSMSIAELPPLDFVVLSHHHGDHFDDVAAAELDKRIPILTTAHAAAKLRGQGFLAATALETWESQDVLRGDDRVRVTAMPGRHGPGPLDALLPPVMGTMLEFGRHDRSTFRLYITGDTLLHDRLAEIPRRYPEIDLALVHLGGTKVLGVLVTMNASQGVRALQLIRPRTAVPIHYSDYTVFKEPLSVFKDAVAAASLPTNVRYVSHGETYRFDLDLDRDRSERAQKQERRS